MADTLGLRVVAEGIETEEQLALLQEMGCELGQGFLFSPAVPIGEVETMLSEAPWQASWPQASWPQASWPQASWQQASWQQASSRQESVG